MTQLTQARVKELLHYNAETGTLTWLVKRGRVAAGYKVTSIRNDGYIQVGIDGCRYMAHRIIWLYETGSWPSSLVDHIDGG